MPHRKAKSRIDAVMVALLLTGLAAACGPAAGDPVPPTTSTPPNPTPSPVASQQPQPVPKPDETKKITAKEPAAKSPKNDGTGGFTPLNPQKTVLLDTEGKRVLLKAKVVLREGLLEMLCCLKYSKEHESILSLDSKAYVVHAGLLSLGAEPGKPVQFQPTFQPPTGQKIDIYLQWTDETGKLNRVPAKEWVRHAVRRYYGHPLESKPADLEIPKESELHYDAKHKELAWFGQMTAKQKEELTALSQDAAYRKAIQSFYDRSQPRPMEADWVFAGSGFYVDENGQRLYQAEGGDLICVANFATAMIDVSIQSSASGDQVSFEPVTERIPPVDTEVTIELIPVFEKPADPAK